ncbi:MAG: serine/threonine protein kinase [Planctomycetes bacterium]|nr:serine/threonine protein kinase [Planctomycetota bacterium]
MDGPTAPQRDRETVRAEGLLAGIIHLDPADQDNAFAELCREHPALADELAELRALHRRLMGPADPSTKSGGEQFGPFELIRPLGSGGMGMVWLARQRLGGMDREVALKMVRARGLFSTDARERFRREARALFRVEHPGICPIYDVGEVDGTPWLAMRHVPGRSLAELIVQAREAGAPLQVESKGPSPVDAILALIESIARALHAAHEVGLVHRDVKPSNVIVTPSGDPVLLDFGLARAIGEDSDLTLTGAPIGTPAYMSPEQVAGRHAEIDRTTDVWSLAVTLVECLTLETPFAAESREAMYRRILAEEWVAPRRTQLPLPRNLDVVIATALRKEPARRYRTAQDFADDLAAVRKLLPTRARRLRRVERTTLWIRRNRAVSALLVLLALSLVASIALAIEAGRRAEVAVRSQQLAEDSFAEARRSMEETVAITRDELDDVPRFSAQRTRMLESAIRFYERFAELRADDPAFALEVVDAWRAVGEIQYEIGRFEAADDALRKAEEIVATLRTRNDARLGVTQATIDQRRGAIAARFGRVEEGVTRLRRAIAFWRERIAADDQTLPLRLRALSTTSSLVNVLSESGDLRGALAAGTDALESFGFVPAVGDAQGRVALSRLIGIVAKLELGLGRAADSERRFGEALELITAFAEREDCDSDLLSLVAVQLDERAELRALQNRFDDAIADRRRALRYGEQLLARDPDSFIVKNNLGSAYCNLAQTLARRGELDAARTNLARARELFEKLAADRADDPAVQVQLAITWYALGDVEKFADDPAASIAAHRRCVATLEAIASPGGRAFEVDRLLGRAWSGIASGHVENLEFESAEDAFAAGAAALERLLARRPDDRRLIDDKARLAFNRGIACDGRGAFAAAVTHYDTAHAAFGSLLASDARPPAILLETMRAAARAALSGLIADTVSTPANAHDRLAAIETAPPTVLDAARSQPRFARDLAMLQLVVAIGIAKEDASAARAKLDAVARSLDGIASGVDADWLALLKGMTHATAATLVVDDGARHVTHLDALRDALEVLARGRPPFPDLAHVVAHLLDGVDALHAALPSSEGAALGAAIAKVRRRLAGE